MTAVPLDLHRRPKSGSLPRGWNRPGARTPAWLVPLMLVASVVPLLWPTVPPLIDLPNHMSRYRIGLEYATSPWFRQWFDFHWVLVGNLGVDLLATLLAPLVGLELATKLVVLAIPLTTVAGMALIAREIHGRVPLTAAFAVPLAYNYPLNFGFVNFALSAGLALLAFGLWLRLGRLGRTTLRQWLFVPIGFLVWLAHACGWGMLGVMVGTAALAEARGDGLSLSRAMIRTLRAAAPLAVSLVPMLLWLSGSPLTPTTNVMAFSIPRKIGLLFFVLRNDAQYIDIASLVLLLSVPLLAVARRDLAFDRRLAAVAAAMTAVFLAMPLQLMGAFHSDTRLAPYALALWLLALRPTGDGAVVRLLGGAALAFLVARLGYQTASFIRLDRVYARQLPALDHVPIGARVFGFARAECEDRWAGDRLQHLNRMAIVRRDAFTNGTWPPPGSQTLFVHPNMIAGFHDDGSQLFLPRRCRSAARSLGNVLASLPRDRFDYVWLIGVPPALWPQRDWLRPVWHGTDGVLYRIARPAAPTA